MENDTLLQINNLAIYYHVPRGYVKAVDGVSLEINRRETVGLLGESGSGKTTMALAILKLLPYNAEMLGGEILLDGEDLVSKSEEDMRKIRGKRISMVFQGALSALNPVYRIGDQIVEAMLVHQDIDKREARERMENLLRLVHLSPEKAKGFPHELSGGMKQRAMLAMALTCDPELVMFDEPTTALDVIVQDKILEEIKKMQNRVHMSMLIITHDIAVIFETCDTMAVMYGGKIMEFADTVSLFKRRVHPYTQGLLSSFPTIKGAKRKLHSIPGSPIELLNPPSGCRFRARCSYATDLCKKDPEIIEIDEKHYVACHYSNKFAEGSVYEAISF